MGEWVSAVSEASGKRARQASVGPPARPIRAQGGGWARQEPRHPAGGGPGKVVDQVQEPRSGVPGNKH
eukprot:7220325-Heterocapsa_arctica.AAC.1